MIVRFDCGGLTRRYETMSIQRIGALLASVFLTQMLLHFSNHSTCLVRKKAKMAQSSVLYIHVTGLTSEIIKNLVLAGVRAVVCDGRPYPATVRETPSFFFPASDFDNENDATANGKEATDTQPTTKKIKCTVADVMRPRIEELNPLLGDCQISTDAVAHLTDDFLKTFSIIIASRIGISDAIRISDVCTSMGHKFYMADCFGMAGASLFDLGANHTYRPELGKELLDETMLKTHVSLSTALLQVPLSDATNRFHKSPPSAWLRYRCLLEYAQQTNAWPTVAQSDDFSRRIRSWIQETSPSLVDCDDLSKQALEKLATVASAEVAPVCSVLGGILGNEVIKAISGKGEPANNTILFDGDSCKAWTFLVQPKAS